MIDINTMREIFDKSKVFEIGKSGGKTFIINGHYIKYWPVVKKMKSKSKQPRYVRVVMKGEWK